MAQTKTDRAAEREAKNVVEEYFLGDIKLHSKVGQSGALHWKRLNQLATKNTRPNWKTLSSVLFHHFVTFLQVLS